MNGNFRMVVLSLLLFLAFFFSAHDELMYLRFTSKMYTGRVTQVKTFFSIGGSYQIRPYPFSTETIHVQRIQNQDDTIRAFLYDGVLYIEQYSPRRNFIVIGDFAFDGGVSDMYFSSSSILIARAKVASPQGVRPATLTIDLERGEVAENFE